MEKLITNRWSDIQSIPAENYIFPSDSRPVHVKIPFSSNIPVIITPYCYLLLLAIAAAMFDWQAKMATLAAAPKVARVATPPPLPTLQVVSFAQALTGSSRVASNDNLPQPIIRGETLSVKITQEIYDRGTDFCKTNLRGRLVLNKGDKPYATKKIESRLQKLWKTAGA